MAQDPEIVDVLRGLIGRQDISAETREELKEFQAQAQSGTLDPADRKYVLALAQRLGGKKVAGSVADAETLEHYEEETSWRDRFHEAEARAAAADAKLQAVKASFERMFGPAAEPLAGVDATSRQNAYDAFKRELERIEKGEG